MFNNLAPAIQAKRLQLLFSRRIERSNPSFIPIHLTGGIGDVIMSIDPLKELAKKFQLAIYTGYPDVLKRFSGITACRDIPSYTWHLSFNTVTRFHFHEGFLGFLLPAHEHLYLGQQARFKESPYLYELVKQHPHKDFLLSRYAIERGLNRRTFPLYSLGL